MQMECIMHARSDIYRISAPRSNGLRTYARAIGHAIVQIGNNGKLKNYDGSNPYNKLLKIPCAIGTFPFNISLV